MAALAEQRRVSTPSRWVFALLLLASALLAVEAARQFAMPGDPTVRDVPLTLPLDRDAQLFTLSNHAQVWLLREPDGTIQAFSARSPWNFGPAVRFEPISDQRWVPAQVFYDGWTSFDRLGGAHVGPATRGLDRFDVRQVAPDRVVLLDGTHVTLGWCRDEIYPHCSRENGPFPQALAKPPAQAR
jgi:hypothetical protein